MQSKFTAALLALLVAGAGWYVMLAVGDDDGSPIQTQADGEPTGSSPSLELLPQDLRRVSKEDFLWERESHESREPHLVLCAFVGTVLNEHHQPVADLQVEVRLRTKTITATTDAKGEYQFQAMVMQGGGRFDTGTVVARDDEGRFGSASFDAPSWDTEPVNGELHEIILPIYLHKGLRVTVRVKSDQENALPARVWLVSGWGQSAMAENWTDANGTAEFGGVTRNYGVRVVAASPASGRASAHVFDRTQDAKLDHVTIDLKLPASRKLTVHVRERDSKRPIPNATVAVRDLFEHQISQRFVSNPSGTRKARPPTYLERSLFSHPSTYLSDEEGNVVVTGLGKEARLLVRVSAEGYPDKRDRYGRPKREAVHVTLEESSVTVELVPARVVTWAIDPKSWSNPSDGTSVLIRAHNHRDKASLPDRGVIKGGTIIVEGWATGPVEAQAVVDGVGAALLKADADATEGPAVVFSKERKVKLIAKWADGKGAGGAYLIVEERGGMGRAPRAMCQHTTGKAVVAGLYGGPGARATCYVSRDGTKKDAKNLGEIALDEGDAHFEYTFPPDRTARIAITIEGVAPPPSFFVRAQVIPSDSVVPGDASSHLVELKPGEDGVAEVKFRPRGNDDRLLVVVRDERFAHVKPQSVSLAGTGDVHVSLPLVRLYRARIEVLLPKDLEHRVLLQRWNEQEQGWEVVSTHVAQRTDGTGLIAFDQLKAGRYRAIDSLSLVTTAPFELGLGSEPTEPALDLTKTGWVNGRVKVPDGIQIREVSVDVEGDQLPSVKRGSRGFRRERFVPGLPILRSDGKFSIRVSGVAPVTIRAFHPTLEPHPTLGRFTASGPRDDVELHLIAGARATLHFKRVAPPASTVLAAPRVAPPPRRRFLPASRVLSGLSYREVHVRLLPEGTRSIPIRLRGLMDASNGTVVFSGYRPGRYTILIDTLIGVPFVLKGIRLTREDTDLGSHELQQGSGIKLRLNDVPEVKPTFRGLDHFVTIEPLASLGAPRQVSFYGNDVRIGALAKGRYRIRLTSSLVPHFAFDEIIEVDGKTDVERVVEIR